MASHDAHGYGHAHDDPRARSHGGHRHGHDQGHGHTHGTVDPALLSTAQGISAVKWSLVILAVTAAVQIVVVLLTGSVALLADTVHNGGDALTAVPLWIAFSYARRPPTKRYTYGFGRLEDLAGIAVVLTILFSALFAGYESVLRIVHPQTITHLGAVAAAAMVGFLGNEAVAQLRIRAGRRIASVALVADGHHARIDGFTSLAVLAGAVGVWLGFPLADPIVGLLIALAIMRIVWQSAKSVLSRAIDGVDPEIVDEIHEALARTPSVVEVTETRVRWLGHRMLAEVNVAVDAHSLSRRDTRWRWRFATGCCISSSTSRMRPCTSIPTAPPGKPITASPSIATTTCRSTSTSRSRIILDCRTTRMQSSRRQQRRGLPLIASPRRRRSLLSAARAARRRARCFSQQGSQSRRSMLSSIWASLGWSRIPEPGTR